MKKIAFVLMCLFALSLAACAAAPNVIVVTQTPEASTPDGDPDTPLTPKPPEQSDEPANEAAPAMYSSFAHMVSCDFITTLAEFDYFDILQGQEAIKWLIEKEGYTEAKARASVDEFADSEYIEKNTNPQLRTIDLSKVELKLILKPDGELIEGLNPDPCGMEELYALWAADPAYVFDHYFYYITVTDGKVNSVEQVYWP